MAFKNIITSLLLLICLSSVAQQTRPLGPKLFSYIAHRDSTGKVLPNNAKYFNLCLTVDTAVTNNIFLITSSVELVYVKRYKGKWYSNYPYKVSTRKGIYKVYKNGRLFITYLPKKSEIINLKEI